MVRSSLALAPLQLLTPTVLLLGFLGLVGLATHRVLGGSGVLPPHWGSSVGVGTGIALPVIALSYVVTGNATVPVLIVGATALAVVLFSATRALIDHLKGFTRPQRRSWGFRFVPDRVDVTALAISLAIVGPMLQFGATFWTRGPNDGPNYFASAQVWLTSAGQSSAFAARHPDFFGEFQVARAGFEKPMATAMYVTADVVTGMESYRLLTPVLLVALFVTAQALLRTLSDTLGLPLQWAAACVILPMFSIVVVSRVHDAHVGQVLAAALLSQLVLLVATGARAPSPTAPLPIRALPAGLVAAAALGSNFTVVAASVPTVLALGYGVARLSGADTRRTCLLLGAITSWALLLSVPLSSWYKTSAALQTSGALGLQLSDSSPMVSSYLMGTPLGVPSPLALIGLEPSYSASVAGSWVALCAWLLFAIAASFALLRHSSAGQTHQLFVKLGLVWVANALVLVILSGVGSYGFYKWFGVFTVLVMPVLLGRVVSGWARETRRSLAPLAAALVLASGSIALNAAREIESKGFVASPQLLALADDPTLTSGGHVNIDMGNWMDNSAVAVIIPSPTMTVTRRTYAKGGAPTGDVFLVPRESVPKGPDVVVVPLSERFSLVRRDMRVTAGLTRFADERNDRLIYGDAYRPTGSAQIATGAHSSLALTLAAGARRSGVVVSLAGTPYLQPDGVLKLTLGVGDRAVRKLTFRNGGPVRLTFDVAAEEIGTDGTLVITLATDANYTLGPLGFATPVEAGFGLSTLRVDDRSDVSGHR